MGSCHTECLGGCVGVGQGERRKRKEVRGRERGRKWRMKEGWKEEGRRERRRNGSDDWKGALGFRMRLGGERGGKRRMERLRKSSPLL